MSPTAQRPVLLRGHDLMINPPCRKAATTTIPGDRLRAEAQAMQRNV